MDSEKGSQMSGLFSKVKQKNPKLSSKYIQSSFAKKHRNSTVSNRERVIFLNECKIDCFNSDGRSWC